jgi:hypothetical protein
MLVRQREQGPIIQRIGDIFLGAAAEFRMVYPVYVGNLPVAEKRVKEEAESNVEFRRFLEVRQHFENVRRTHFSLAKRSVRCPWSGYEALHSPTFGTSAKISGFARGNF